jgi:hypothetical protein
MASMANASLLDTADRLFEESRFDLAVDAYRRAISAEEHSAKAFANLAIACDMEVIAFHLALAKQHPTWLTARLALAHAYLQARRPEQALAECKSVLDAGLGPVGPVHIVRYKAAVRANAVDVACNDFSYIWELGRTDQAARKLRKTLIEELATVRDPEGARLMAALIKALPNEAELADFLSAKIAELRYLRKCAAEWGAGIDSQRVQSTTSRS